MPSVSVKLYSVFFKLLLKHRLQNRIQNPNPLDDNNNNTNISFGVTSRPEESIAAVNPSFTDGVATKDIHIDSFTSLSIRIFLPDTCLLATTHPDFNHTRPQLNNRFDPLHAAPTFAGSIPNLRRNSFGSPKPNLSRTDTNRRNSYAFGADDSAIKSSSSSTNTGSYRGYTPSSTGNSRKLPILLQFHGGGFVSGSCDSMANDFFCRRIAKVCDVIVLAVGYRLAPENRYPAAFEDGLQVLHWLAKQSNLAECSKSLGISSRVGGPDTKKSDVQRHIADAFGASMAEPWLAAHGDPSRT